MRGNNRSPQCKAITDAEQKRVCQWNVGNDQLKFLMALPNESSRIKRFYYYAFRGVGINPNDPARRGHDSGLLDPLRELRRVDDRGTPDANDDQWVREYPRARQLRNAYCTYGATIDPPFTFASEGDTIRACPYSTAVIGD